MLGIVIPELYAGGGHLVQQPIIGHFVEGIRARNVDIEPGATTIFRPSARVGASIGRGDQSSVALELETVGIELGGLLLVLVPKIGHYPRAGIGTSIVVWGAG